MRPLLHEQFIADLNYRIAEADKNASMHAATASTLRSLKDLFERRTEDERRFQESQRPPIDAGDSQGSAENRREKPQ
jgi:hypothetical protein